MNILIVTAHPSSKGFTHQIADKYRTVALDVGHQVEILDLYTSNIQQEFLRFEDPDDLKVISPSQTKMQQKISWADHIILIFPLWWFDSPAILKNWFEQNFTSGFAFEYTSQNSLSPQRLLTGKTASLFITADGPGWLYAIIRPFVGIWKRGRLGFCGIKLRGVHILGSKRKKTPVQLEQWLTKVERIARKR